MRNPELQPLKATYGLTKATEGPFLRLEIKAKKWPLPFQSPVGKIQTCQSVRPWAFIFAEFKGQKSYEMYHSWHFMAAGLAPSLNGLSIRPLCSTPPLLLLRHEAFCGAFKAVGVVRGCCAAQRHKLMALA